MKRLTLTLTLLGAVGCWAQQAAPITTSQLTFTANAPNPAPPSVVNVTRVGTAGSNTYYYWVTSELLIGWSTPSSPALVTSSNGTLDTNNYNRVTWNPVPGAIEYQVLRTTSNVQPAPGCMCATTGGATSSTSFNDQSNTLGAYSNSPWSGDSSIVANNLVTAAGTTQLQLNFGGTRKGYVPVATGSPVAGNCVEWAAVTTVEDAGAPCGSGSGLLLQTNGTNNSSQTALNLVASTGITLTNTSGGSVSIAASGGGASSGTNLIQVSNGSGGFISNTGLRADTTNGFLGIRNDSTAPQSPLDMTWGSLADGASGENLATFSQTISSTSASPGNTHQIDLGLTFNGTDGAFADTTDAMLYASETDNRTPTAASTSGHELGIVSRLNFNGGANLTCIDGCGAFYATAGTGAVGNVTSLLDYDADGGAINGTGTVGQWASYSAGFPSVGGTAHLNNAYGFLSGDPVSASHGLGSGCMAAFSVNLCSGTTTWAFFSASTAPSAMAGGLSLLSTTAPGAGIALDAEGEVDAATISGTNPAIGFRDSSAGSVRTWINKPARAIGHLKLPSDAGTFSDEAGSYDSATAITGNLTAQTLFAFPDSNSRFFRLVVYGVCTTSVAGSTVMINFAYTDEQQAQTVSSSAQTCAAAGDILTFTAPAYANTSNVTISTTTVNSPVYLLHARLELLGPDTFGSN